MSRSVPTLVEETRLRADGYGFIAGIDEAGRGALMGPVVAAAVILPENAVTRLDGVTDSKQLAPQKREELFDVICDAALAWGVGVISHEIIDAVGIVKATRKAMLAAIERLDPVPDYLLIDHFRLRETKIPHHGITRGDSISLSIAAASILAKVSRDRLVREMDGVYPGYGFAAHKGYGTAAHLACLRERGPCPVHRRTFRPVRDIIMMI